MKVFAFIITFLSLPLFHINTVLSSEFQTTVSRNFTIPNTVEMVAANSVMNTDWFVEKAGGRTVWSNDVYVGHLVHGIQGNQIMAHATWAIIYYPRIHTVNLKLGLTHITNWYYDQRCNVFEDGTCRCGLNANWRICEPAMWDYANSLIAYAIAASTNAKLALEALGYKVIRTP